MLDTDRINTREYQEVSLRMALGHYHALLREGYNPLCARCQAIAYFARKTRLAWPMASGIFDTTDKEPT